MCLLLLVLCERLLKAVLLLLPVLLTLLLYIIDLLLLIININNNELLLFTSADLFLVRMTLVLLPIYLIINLLLLPLQSPSTANYHGKYRKNHSKYPVPSFLLFYFSIMIFYYMDTFCYCTAPQLLLRPCMAELHSTCQKITF